MYSGEDVIRLLRTELPRLTGKFSFGYSYRMAMTDHVITGSGEGHEDAQMLLKHLEKYKPDRVEFTLTLY